MAYIFTFGSGQQNAGHYVRIEGDFGTAREEMVSRFGLEWGFQYSEEEWEDWCKKARQVGFPIETELK